VARGWSEDGRAGRVTLREGKPLKAGVPRDGLRWLGIGCPGWGGHGPPRRIPPKPGSPPNVPKSNGSTLAPGMQAEKDEGAQCPSAVRVPPGASSTGRDRTKRHEKELSMSTIKVIELVGLSPKSWHAAVEGALKEAAKSLHGISGIDVMSTTAAVRDNKITEYRATVKIAFLVEKGKK